MQSETDLIAKMAKTVIGPTKYQGRATPGSMLCGERLFAAVLSVWNTRAVADGRDMELALERVRQLPVNVDVSWWVLADQLLRLVDEAACS